jgi:hypothetical protein
MGRFMTMFLKFFFFPLNRDFTDVKEDDMICAVVYDCVGYKILSRFMRESFFFLIFLFKIT